MRVFVTGASGFVGAAVVAELMAAGHSGARPRAVRCGRVVVAAAGADVHRGSLEDLDSLTRGARSRRRGDPYGIQSRLLALRAELRLDRRAIETIGAALAGRRGR